MALALGRRGFVDGPGDDEPASVVAVVRDPGREADVPVPVLVDAVD